MKDGFQKVLRGLGHIYCEHPEPEHEGEPDRIRHIGMVYQPTGKVLPICSENPDTAETQNVLGCPALWLDSNCAECRKCDGSDYLAITKRSLMLNIIHALINTEQLFLDAMYWNFHNPNEKPMNPDPDGFLAEEWQKLADQIIQMLERARPTMTKHGDKFGWPETVEEKDGSNANDR